MKEAEKCIAHKAYALRVDVLRMTTAAGSGHATSALSAADIVAVLFFYAMRNDDQFVLSKGHAAPVLYAAWKQRGAFADDQLMTYRKMSSVLEGHPTPRFFGAPAATGSLGQGLSVGLGMSLAARLDGSDVKTYVLLGDGELAEGSVWEAAEVAAYYKAENLVAVVDVNRLGQTGETMEGHDLEHYAQKFSAFGWHVIKVDGHAVGELMRAVDEAKKITGRPTVILAKTLKGYGVALAQDKNGFHGKAFSQEELPSLLAELKKTFAEAAAYQCAEQQSVKLPSRKKITNTAQIPAPSYTKGEAVPTRKAYGQALAALGSTAKNLVSLDAEVKNSTFAELFEAAHPERFFQCFIAEQNMVGMGVGMAAAGKIAYLSTFACFFSRAHDQIRMAAIGQSSIKLVGSHAGVSIGEDGPSQMGLEDIALFRALPKSVVLYPCDAVSTWKLVGAMANYQDGLSYLRTTRGATPVVYDNNEQFSLGGCKVLRENKSSNTVCVVAAGITIHEALKAHELLKNDGIEIAVIDLYSIKPLDEKTLKLVAQKSNNRVLTVEDHYLEGGLGEAVVYALRNTGVTIECLAVTKLPCSGSIAELLAYEGIDAAAIVKKIKEMAK